jgi:rhamnogalacturonan hydrolase
MFGINIIALSLLLSTVSAQLTKSVGPLTKTSAKRSVKQCNVLDYGAKADKSTDLAPGLTAAFNACKSGGVVIIPSGNYALAAWVTLSGGNAWALQLDGMIYRNAATGGNMIFIEHTTDFELFSSTSSGGMQGLGYQYHAKGDTSGPRLLRLYEATSFSVHDIVLVDSPLFHLTCDTCEQGEFYNMAIRGGNMGGIDGVDLWGDNLWAHDIEVTNKDECVTIKVSINSVSPSTRSGRLMLPSHQLQISSSNPSTATGLAAAR